MVGVASSAEEVARAGSKGVDLEEKSAGLWAGDGCCERREEGRKQVRLGEKKACEGGGARVCRNGLL